MIALTGPTGFLGAHLREALRGDDVTLVSRSPVDGRSRVADVLDVDALTAAFDGADVVIHAAGDVDHRPEAAERMYRLHVDGGRNVLTAARRAGARRIVLVSSSGTRAVGVEPVVRDEGAPLARTVAREWSYYRAKIAAEALFLAATDLEVVSVNPSLLLGPGDLRGGSVSVVKRFLDGRVPVAPPGGLSFADVRDVAQAVATAVERGRPGHVYLLGAANWTFALFYERIARVADRPTPTLRAPGWLGKALGAFPAFGRESLPLSDVDRYELELACHHWYVDDSKARAELDWRPRDPMETLADTVWDLRQRGRTAG